MHFAGDIGSAGTPFPYGMILIMWPFEVSRNDKTHSQISVFFREFFQRSAYYGFAKLDPQSHVWVIFASELRNSIKFLLINKNMYSEKWQAVDIDLTMHGANRIRKYMGPWMIFSLSSLRMTPLLVGSSPILINCDLVDHWYLTLLFQVCLHGEFSSGLDPCLLFIMHNLTPDVYDHIIF